MEAYAVFWLAFVVGGFLVLLAVLDAIVTVAYRIFRWLGL